MSGKFGVLGIMDNWQKGDLPRNQEVSIVLNSYSMSDNGVVGVTPNLVSDEEIDYHVDQLIRDLEHARSAAKKNLKAVNARIRDGL